jgi:hypothetical protein
MLDKFDKQFSNFRHVVDKVDFLLVFPRRLNINGLPKIHKEGVPLRPTVSNIGAPTYQLSKYLVGLLGPLTGNSTHHVKNSFHFI